MEQAIIEMLNGRKGPVWIEVPLDIQGSEYIEENQIHLNIENKIKKINFKSDEYQSWAPEIASKKRIVLLAGQGVRLDDAVEKLNKFASKNKIIVTTTFPGKDCFAYDNPLFIGHPGTVAKRSANIAFKIVIY